MAIPGRFQYARAIESVPPERRSASIAMPLPKRSGKALLRSRPLACIRYRQSPSDPRSKGFGEGNHRQPPRACVADLEDCARIGAVHQGEDAIALGEFGDV